MSGVVAGRGSATGGFQADAAVRLWRAPVCAFVGVAVAVGVARVLASTGSASAIGPVSTAVAAALAAGFLAGSLLFWALTPSRRTAGSDEQALVHLGVPVLAAVPEMVTARERELQGRHRRRGRLLSAAVSVVSALAALWVLSRVL